MIDSPASEADFAALREAIALSAEARAGGFHPFGAMVLDVDGGVLARAGNGSAAGRDPTAHAETLALRLAAPGHGSAALAGGMLVSSAEPCAMCAGAAYWAGLSRVVYGLSEKRLRTMTGDRFTLGSGRATEAGRPSVFARRQAFALLSIEQRPVCTGRCSLMLNRRGRLLRSEMPLCVHHRCIGLRSGH